MAMQIYEKKCANGSVHTYTLTDPDQAVKTRHRWATKDWKPFLHIMPSEGGYCSIFIFCGDRGYLRKGELMVPFDELKVEQIAF